MDSITSFTIAGTLVTILVTAGGKYIWQRFSGETCFSGDSASGEYDTPLKAAEAAQKELSKSWSERI